jgi:hypothetical protein
MVGKILTLPLSENPDTQRLQNAGGVHFPPLEDFSRAEEI